MTARMLLRYAPLSTPDTVVAFLGRLGVGQLVDSDITAPAGRNDIWAGTTDAGVPVLVKRLVGHPDDMRRRMQRLIAMSALPYSSGAIAMPEMLGADEESHLVAYRYLDGARSANEVAADDALDPDLMSGMGGLLAALHTFPPPDAVPEQSTRWPANCYS